MRALRCLETSPSDYPLDAASYYFYVRCATIALQTPRINTPGHLGNTLYEILINKCQTYTKSNQITGCSFYSFLTAWQHYCTKYVGRNSTWHWKLCSKRLITNPANHKQNTTVHIKETSCILNLFTVHTCRYISKSQFKLAGTYQNSDRGIRVVW